MNLNGLKNSKYANALIFGFYILTVTFAKPQLNPGNLTQYTQLDGVPGAQVSKVIADKFGYEWLGTINGLLASMNIGSIYGPLWIGTGDHGLFMYEETSYFA